MKSTLITLLTIALSVLATPVDIEDRGLEKRAQPQGVDVSHWQGNVDWTAVKNAGYAFAYVKATEGTTYQDPTFNHQYSGSYNAGLIRGSYHFARPDTSSGAAQAKYFVAHGGGWSADGKTLPGTLDIEYAPSGDTCYGLSDSAMVKWIADFSNTYHSLTKRYPTIYSTTDWWKTCTGNSAAFATTNALWIARYSSSVGTLPAGWQYHTIWQYTDKGKLGFDTNYWNGDLAGLKRYATG